MPTSVFDLVSEPMVKYLWWNAIWHLEKVYSGVINTVISHLSTQFQILKTFFWFNINRNITAVDIPTLKITDARK